VGEKDGVGEYEGEGAWRDSRGSELICCSRAERGGICEVEGEAAAGVGGSMCGRWKTKWEESGGGL